MLVLSQGKGEPVPTLSDVSQPNLPIVLTHALSQRDENNVEDEEQRWADVLSQDIPSIIF